MATLRGADFSRIGRPHRGTSEYAPPVARWVTSFIHCMVKASETTLCATFLIRSLLKAPQTRLSPTCIHSMLKACPTMLWTTLCIHNLWKHIEYLEQRVGRLFLCSKKTPWGWHLSAETCRSLIFAMSCILLSIYVGWYITRKHIYSMHNLTKLESDIIIRSYCAEGKCTVAPHSVITVSLFLDCPANERSSLQWNVCAYTPIYIISFLNK